MTERGRDAGVSLLELVVVLALFSTVALLGTQALRVSLRLQKGLSAHAAAADGLTRGLALLRADLENAVRLAPGAVPGSASLDVLGPTDPAEPDVHRLAGVTWRHDRTAATLTRTERAPGAQGAGTPVTVFETVRDFDLRVLDGDTWLPLPRIDQHAAPPRAIEAALRTDRGPLRVLVVP